MKSLLYGTLLGLGLGLGGCASSSTYQNKDVTPQLYYQLMGQAKPTKEGGRVGAVTFDGVDRTLSARAVVEPDGKRFLDVLFIDAVGNKTLYRDGSEGPLDRVVDYVGTGSSEEPQLLVAKNPAAAQNRYLAHLEALEENLAKTPAGKTDEAGPNETIESLLKPSGKGK